MFQCLFSLKRIVYKIRYSRNFKTLSIIIIILIYEAMLLVKLAYLMLILLQLKRNACAVMKENFVDHSIEKLEFTNKSDRYDLRFIQNILDTMYELANSIPQDVAHRILKLIMKKIPTSTSSRQDEYWLLRQGWVYSTSVCLILIKNWTKSLKKNYTIIFYFGIFKVLWSIKHVVIIFCYIFVVEWDNIGSNWLALTKYSKCFRIVVREELCHEMLNVLTINYRLFKWINRFTQIARKWGYFI